MILPILLYPDVKLRQRSVPVGPVTLEVHAFVRNLLDTMNAEEGGAGLAAIQVGDPRRIFVMAPDYVFIDPVITWLSPEVRKQEEGCLSFPGVFIKVPRHLSCRVAFKDRTGQAAEVTYEGFEAHVVQHEYDHLEGKLLIDNAGALRRKLIERRFRR